MKAACIGVVALLAARPARADELHDILDFARTVGQIWSPSQEARIESQLTTAATRIEEAIFLATALLDSNPIRGGSIEVGVTAGGGFDVDRGGAEVAALASAHLDGDRCRILSADLLVRGRTSTAIDDRARASSEGGLSACLPGGIELTADGITLAVFPIRGRVYGALNKTPALTSSRALVPEPYSEAGFGVWTEGLRWIRDPGRYWAFLGMTIEQKYHWLGFPSGQSSRQEIGVDVYFVRLGRQRPPIAVADRAIDFFGFGFHGITTGGGVAVGDFWPLRISGLGLGTDKVLVDAVVGVSGTGTITNDDGSVIDSANVPNRAIAYVHSSLSVGTRPFSVGASYDRGLDTNFLVELVQEDRASLWVKQQLGPLSYTAAAFGSRALHFPDKVIVGEERLAGGSFAGTYVIGGGVAVGLSVEATHAWRRDAVLDGRVAPDGVRAFATVSYTHSIAHKRFDDDGDAPPAPPPTMPPPPPPPPTEVTPPPEPAEPTPPITDAP